MKIFLGLLLSFFSVQPLFSQYVPQPVTRKEMRKARHWVNKTYRNLSQNERLGQLFIVALYTNKGEDFIANVRKIVNEEKIGGLILMQDDAAIEIDLVNEFQKQAKVPLLIGMDAEWGVYQRIPVAHKFPWALTLGAIQDKDLIHQMAEKIAADCKRLGVNWDFAPVVDVNTNPNNPIIGNRSFGSDVQNVIASGSAYVKGLQDSGVLSAIKHFPGHGDTDVDSHLDLPKVSHDLARLDTIELAPFKALIDKGVGGVMVAHLYVPALEQGEGVPASISKNIITGLLKEKLGYKGLIITDALNMGAVAKRYQPGVLDALAFEAGNDIMLFSQDVATGKKLIQEKLAQGKISRKRVKESVKKILYAKYFLGLTHLKPQNPENISHDLNNESHVKLVQHLYSKALTLLKDKNNLLPLQPQETYYYLPLEEAPYQTFLQELQKRGKITLVKKEEITKIPAGVKVIVGFHKDNSTAYKPYKISEESKKILADLTRNHNVSLVVFGSPYALKDIDLTGVSTVLEAYENNDDSMTATARAMWGETKIEGRLPVVVNPQLPFNAGADK